MNERLAQRVYPTILHVLDLLDRIFGRRPGAPPDPREEFPKLKQYLGQLDSGRTTNEDELCKAALIYWIDEVLINAPAPFGVDWRNRHSLEREYFDDANRAWMFYDRAKTARTLSPPDALETFYLCVALGFLGVYRDGEMRPIARAKAVPPKPKANPAPAAPQSPPPDWFSDGDLSQTAAGDTWNFGPRNPNPTPVPTGDLAETHNPDLEVDESVFDAPKVNSQQGAVDLPPTLSEWAGPVFAQISPSRQRSFIPTSPPDSPREARPLTGWAACQRSALALAWMFLITLALAGTVIVTRFF